jgi:endonuclease/exonuclease/phosphatase family metal-dependent hydrolase
MRFVVSIILAVLSLPLYAQSLEDLSFGSDDQFDVVTWNIEWFPKDWNTADSVAVILSAIDADLYGLQEIDDTIVFRNMMNELAQYDYWLDYDGWFGGLAWVYKPSVVAVQDIYKIYEEEEYWNPLPRSPLVMELEYKGQKLMVINNHLKCCGNGLLEYADPYDEETRRLVAVELLKAFMDSHSDKHIILLGDLNDLLTDDPAHNVFQPFLDDGSHYLFADMAIASDGPDNWSYPSWPSHLDHILINNTLFPAFFDPSSETTTIRVDDYMAGGWSAYENTVSDHRPVALKLPPGTPTAISEEAQPDIRLFPNPGNGQLNFVSNHSLQQATIGVFTLEGRMIYQSVPSDLPGSSIQLELSPGVYLVRINASGGSHELPWIVR